jgi:hypothetical protein
MRVLNTSHNLFAKFFYFRILSRWKSVKAIKESCPKRSSCPLLEEYLHNAGYEMSELKGIVITHLHSDHTQAVNEIKRRSGTA